MQNAKASVLSRAISDAPNSRVPRGRTHSKLTHHLPGEVSDATFRSGALRGRREQQPREGR
jgi:hypothetical protein